MQRYEDRVYIWSPIMSDGLEATPQRGLRPITYRTRGGVTITSDNHNCIKKNYSRGKRKNKKVFSLYVFTKIDIELVEKQLDSISKKITSGQIDDCLASATDVMSMLTDFYLTEGGE